MIDRGANLMHGMIGTMIFCNNGLGSLRVDIFIYLSLDLRIVIRVGQLSIYAPLKVPYHLEQSTQRFISIFSAHCLPRPRQVHVGNGVIVFLFGHQPNCDHLDQITGKVDV